MKNLYHRIKTGIFLIIFLASIVANTQPVSAATPNTATIIIQFSDGYQIVREIEFTDATITGIQALQLTGLDIQTVSSAWGDYVCGINGVICDSTGYSTWWGYYSWDGSAWQMYMVGASSSAVTNGSVEGWTFQSLTSTYSLPPANSFIAALDALDYLAAQQSAADGGYVSGSSSAETLIAIGANEISPADWKTGDTAPSLMDFLAANGQAYSETGASAAAKLAVGFDGARVTYPDALKSAAEFYDTTTGEYTQDSMGPQAWGMLGVSAEGGTAPTQAMITLLNNITADNGWEWYTGWGTDTNSTALAIEALASRCYPVDSAIVSNALAYLKSAQNDDGGFPYDPASAYGTDSDVNSTSYVIQAILSAGQDPAGEMWTKNGKSPIDYLLANQLSDGSFPYQSGGTSNILATQQAVPALLLRAYPLHEYTCQPYNNVYIPAISKQ